MLVKYSITRASNTLKSNNILFGINSADYGISYWSGITPPDSGYTIYTLSEARPEPSIVVAHDDAQLIWFARSYGGTNINTVADALTYLNSGTTNSVVVNFDYPNIVTDGLIFHTDANFAPSYPRSGNEWKDLVYGNSNIISGCTYNNGSLLFNGTTNYIEAQSNVLYEFQPQDPYSLFIFFKLTAAQTTTLINNSFGTLLANMNNSLVGYPGWDLIFNYGEAANTIASHLISNWGASNAFKVRVNYNYNDNADNWRYLGFTYDGSCPTDSSGVLSSTNFYLNGQLITSGKTVVVDGFNSGSESITYSSNYRIGSRWISNSSSLPLIGDVAIVQIYDKKLSLAEIQQNYNALKGRFGL